MTRFAHRRRPVSSPARLARAKSARDVNRALGACINGVAHGPATHGKLCERCRDVHRGKEPDPRAWIDIPAATFERLRDEAERQGIPLQELTERVLGHVKAGGE